jgi:hypothetical protein
MTEQKKPQLRFLLIIPIVIVLIAVIFILSTCVLMAGILIFGWQSTFFLPY